MLTPDKCICLGQMWSNVVRKEITWSRSTKSLISSFTDESGWCGHLVSCDPGNQKRSNQTLTKTSKEWKLLSWKCVLFDLDWSTRSLRSGLRMGGGEWEDLAKSKIGKKFERNLGVSIWPNRSNQTMEKSFTHGGGRKKITPGSILRTRKPLHQMRILVGVNPIINQRNNKQMSSKFILL